jgi:hypothetical protein
MSFCTKCGASLGEDMAFCPKCGQAVKAGEAARPVEPPQAVFEENIAGAQAPEQVILRKNQDGKRGKKTLFWACRVGTVFAVLVVTYLGNDLLHRRTRGIGPGQDHSLALKNDGAARARGRDDSSQLGNGTYSTSNLSVPVSGLTGITAIAGGGSHSLALKNDGRVWAWGYNGYGELGNGTNTNSNLPVQVSGLTGITAIAGGYYHSLALKNDGTLWAWGRNNYGQLGNGTNTNNLPVPVSGLTGITAIAGGEYHSLALKNDGTLWAWGYNFNGELGNGTNTSSNVPVQVLRHARSYQRAITASLGIDRLSLQRKLEAAGFNFFVATGETRQCVTATQDNCIGLKLFGPPERLERIEVGFFGTAECKANGSVETGTLLMLSMLKTVFANHEDYVVATKWLESQAETASSLSSDWTNQVNRNGITITFRFSRADQYLFLAIQ